MGLIINERVINVPPNVVTPLLMMLLEEIDTLKTEVKYNDFLHV